MHISATIFFLIAIALYAASAVPGAVAFGILGLFFELEAWIQWFAYIREDKSNDPANTPR